MLSDFVVTNRTEIIERCRARVAARMAPKATVTELEFGIPLFLDQLVATLLSKLGAKADVASSASQHGGELLQTGFSIAQVINDYGDACQTITELSIEQHSVITTEEFQALNLCLDEAISGAVTEYERQRELTTLDEQEQRATEDLGVLAHELRNLLGTATLAFEVLKGGTVGIGGSTGKLLGRSLTGLRDMVDRSLANVRLQTGTIARENLVVGTLIEEMELSSMMAAKARQNRLSIEVRDGSGASVVHADRQILASIIANLVQNAFKHTPVGSHVTLRCSTTTDHVLIEVEDEGGGIPADRAESLFHAFAQGGSDRSGLGLGLAICLRGVAAIGGTLRFRNLSDKGCVFTVELPRVHATSPKS